MARLSKFTIGAVSVAIVLSSCSSSGGKPAAAGSSRPAAAATLKPAAPDVTATGPTFNGTRHNAFGAAAFDVTKYGYVQQEYFIAGTANAYRQVPGTTLSSNGNWRVQKRSSAAYKTRILVTRPASQAKFSGNVVVSWSNVTAGFEITGLAPTSLSDGDAMVSVSAQQVGIDGTPQTPQNGLRGWDPKRYGSLHHPGDDYSYDIFGQAAEAVGPNRATGPVDPMGGLRVTHVFATGGSQSAMRLTSYLDGIQPLTHVFDGALLFVNFGYAAPFVTSAATTAQAGIDVKIVKDVRIRSDLGIPVILITTESEATSLYPVRQANTSTFRTWEVAGAAHGGSAGSSSYIATVFIRDGLAIPKGLGSTSGAPSGVLPDSVSYLFVGHTAQVDLEGWARGRAAPPIFPFMDINGNPPAIVRDKFGNAVGGIRLPELQVPIATYNGSAGGNDQLAALSGSTRPFSHAMLIQLYGTRANYVAKYDQAVGETERAGLYLAEDVPDIKTAGAAAASKAFA
jgi:hypothetical protein